MNGDGLIDIAEVICGLLDCWAPRSIFEVKLNILVTIKFVVFRIIMLSLIPY